MWRVLKFDKGVYREWWWRGYCSAWGFGCSGKPIKGYRVFVEVYGAWIAVDKGECVGGKVHNKILEWLMIE